MKALITYVLSFSLLLNGCMGAVPLTEQERIENHPHVDERAWFVLKDGTSVEAKPFHHVHVS